MAANAPPPHGRLLRAAVLLAVVVVVTSTGLPQQRSRLSGSILGDIGGVVEDVVGGMGRAVSAVVDGVKDALGFSEQEPVASEAPPPPPFQLEMLGQQSGWKCTRCSGVLSATDQSHLSGGPIDLPCTEDGMACTEDGKDDAGYILLCRSNVCGYDYSGGGDDDEGGFGDRCDDGRPCGPDWECNFENVCVDYDS